MLDCSTGNTGTQNNCKGILSWSLVNKTFNLSRLPIDLGTFLDNNFTYKLNFNLLFKITNTKEIYLPIY